MNRACPELLDVLSTVATECARKLWYALPGGVRQPIVLKPPTKHRTKQDMKLTCGLLASFRVRDRVSGAAQSYEQ